MDDRPLRPARPRPDDFEVVFIEQGRLECETWYRARRTTINRWLEESGKTQLIERRAAFVKHLRAQRREPKPITRQEARSRLADRRIHPGVVRRAAHFMRSIRNGGWVVAPMPNGDWLVGTRRRSPAELLDMAVRRGFDRRAANLQVRAEDGIG
jgi:hypothetical protein